jgi:hypothetical protein
LLSLLAALLVCTVLASSEVARHALRIVRYEWLEGRPLIWSVPRTVAACRARTGESHIVLLAIGQSNAANSVRGRYRPSGRVLNFHEGRCFTGEDPVPGATGTGGSVWNRLGDLMLGTRRFETVLVASLAVDATSIADWSPGGSLDARLRDSLRELRVHGLEPTHVLWHQGERDTQLGTGKATYVRHFSRLLANLRANGLEAPVYVARASYCRGRTSEAVRAAQRAVVDARAGVLAGPDTDTLVGPGLRHDDCHFSAFGAALHAALWRDALLSAQR